MFGVSGAVINLYRIFLRQMPAFSETEKYVPCWRNALLQSLRRYKSIKTRGLRPSHDGQVDQTNRVGHWLAEHFSDALTEVLP
jgi:hypothetical protein